MAESAQRSMQWIWRGVAIAALLIGWLFIAWQNRFHVSAPMVFVCLGYLAVIVTIYNLWRTGAAAVDVNEDDADSTWAKPAGALGALEREKRTLLKAIKEAEFDQQMGKLSQRDAEEMIHGYRMRAIDVIKEIDRLGLGTAGTVREQILREVRARVQLEGKAPKKADGKAKAEAEAAKRAEAARAAEAAESGDKAAEASDKVAGTGDKAVEATATPAGTTDKPAAAPKDVPSDEDLDADSTTALEPRQPAKEATP